MFLAIEKIPKFLARGFPIVQWLPKYNLEKGISDIIAGITVGLTLIPQSLAYASLAGLSPEYGLYSSLCGGFIYTIFGTTPQLNIAPTALLSLLTYSYTHKATFGPVPATILLCLHSGVIELLCGIFHLGFLIDFVSAPVVAGFTSAGAIVIASAQIKNLLGLNFTAENFLDVWKNVIKEYNNVRKWDCILSAGCCVTLLILRQIKSFGSPPISNNKSDFIREKCKYLKVFIWFLSVSRNALVVISCAVAAYVLNLYGMNPFSLTYNCLLDKVTNQKALNTSDAVVIFSLNYIRNWKKTSDNSKISIFLAQVPSGLPNVSVPLFEVHNNNRTFSYLDMISELGMGIGLVPMIAILGNVAIAKAFARGKIVDASQEMVAVGLCNIVGCFFSSMPVNASFARAAVSNASGTRTPFGGIYTSLMVILSLTFLTPYFEYIPKATLASVIICAVIFMVEVSVVKPIWKVNKIEWISLWVTFLSCLLLGIEYGIFVGISIDILLLLYYNARPKITTKIIEMDGMEYLQITPSSWVLFPASQHLRNVAMTFDLEFGKVSRYVILDCSQINKIDYTSAKGIAMLALDLYKLDKILITLKANRKIMEAFRSLCSIPVKFANNEDDLKEIFCGRSTDEPETKGIILLNKKLKTDSAL